tara:strand:+ start:2753 stop:3040 length:288 start_codon:yes stop_codon:yes gene_type:complete
MLAGCEAAAMLVGRDEGAFFAVFTPRTFECLVAFTRFPGGTTRRVSVPFLRRFLGGGAKTYAHPNMMAKLKTKNEIKRCVSMMSDKLSFVRVTPI